MAKTLATKMAGLPKSRRAEIEARAAELIAEEMSLCELRKALDKTQVRIAKNLGVGQDTVSRIEQRTDMLLSTLQGFVKAMGGDLVLLAEFPDRLPVRLTTLGALGPDRTRARRRAHAREQAGIR